MILLRSKSVLHSSSSCSVLPSESLICLSIISRRHVYTQRFDSEALKHKIPIVSKIETPENSRISINCHDLIKAFNTSKEFSNDFRKHIFDQLVTKFKRPSLLLPNYLNVPITNLTTEEVFVVLSNYISSKDYEKMKAFHREYLSNFINPEIHQKINSNDNNKNDTNENSDDSFYIRYVHFLRNKLNKNNTFNNNVFITLIFIDLCFVKFGSVDFQNFSHIEREILNSLRYNIDEYELSEVSRFLAEIQIPLAIPIANDQIFNEFITTLLVHESLQPKSKRNGDFINFYWSFKLPAYRTSADLTALLKHTIIDLKDYETAIQLYSQYPNLHTVGQFDFMLKSYGRIQDWRALQSLFDSLFSYDKLPNILHYSITMFALASNDHYEECSLLYKQIIDRKMVPSEFIFYSMMLAAFKSHNYEDVSLWFYRYREFAQRTNILSSIPGEFPKDKNHQPYTENNKYNNDTTITPLTIPKDIDSTNNNINNESVPVLINMYQLLSAGFSKLHKVDLSLKLFNYIQQRHPTHLSVHFATPVIDGYAVVGDYLKMEQFMTQLLKRSLEDNEKHNNALVDDILMANYMNVFVRNNRVNTVEHIFKTYPEMSGGQQPGIEMYNALLESKILIGPSQDFNIRFILNEIKDKCITVNSRYYVLLIKFYCKMKDYSEITGLFAEMEESQKSQGCRPSTIHYRTFMEGCLLNKRYDLVMETYNQMLKKNIFLDSHCNLILSKAIFHSDSASLTEGSEKFKSTFDIINKFFEYSFQNATESHFKNMSNTTTMGIVNNCIRFMVAKIDTNNAVSILERYTKLLEMTNYKGINTKLTNYRMSLLRNMILINGSQRNYSSVRKLFDDLLNVIIEFHTVTFAGSENPAKQIHWRYRSYIVYILRYKIEQLFYDHDFDDTLDLLLKLRRLNFKLDSYDYNNTLLKISNEYLRSDYHKFEKVLSFLEEERSLIKNANVLKLKKHLIKKYRDKDTYDFHIPDFHLSYKSCLELKRCLREYVTEVANSQVIKELRDCTEPEEDNSKEILIDKRRKLLEEKKLEIYCQLDTKYPFAVSNIRATR